MFDVIISALSPVLVWFREIFVAVSQTIWNITIDLIIAAFDLFLSAIGALISSALALQLLTQYSLQSLVSQTGSDILHLVSVFNTPQSLAMFGVGIVLRLFMCRLFTLGRR